MRLPSGPANPQRAPGARCMYTPTRQLSPLSSMLVRTSPDEVSPTPSEIHWRTHTFRVPITPGTHLMTHQCLHYQCNTPACHAPSSRELDLLHAYDFCLRMGLRQSVNPVQMGRQVWLTASCQGHLTRLLHRPACPHQLTSLTQTLGLLPSMRQAAAMPSCRKPGQSKSSRCARGTHPSVLRDLERCLLRQRPISWPLSQNRLASGIP